MKGHVIEPMQPELAEAVRPASCKTRSRRACPCPVWCAHCTSVTQLDEPRYVRLSATVVADGRPGALRSEDMQDTPGALLQAASGSHSAAVSFRSHYYGNARTCHRRRRSRRKPAAACGTRASRMHKEHAACHHPSQIGRQRLPCAQSHVRASGRACTFAKMPDVERTFCAQSRPTNMRPMPALRLDARDWLAPRSHHIAGLLEVECEG